MADTVARVGLLVPSSNSTMEPEFYRALPDTCTLHTARLFLTSIDYDSWMQMNSEVERGSRYLASADMDIVVFGCTGASFAKGLGYDREIMEKIEAAGGKQATTTSTAVVEALRKLGATKIAMGTPYDEAVNARGRTFLEGNGFELVSLDGLGYVDNLKVGRLDPETAFEMGKRVDRPDADVVFLSCTNWLTMSIIDRLEAELGKTVITSNQVSLWAALRRVGFTGSVSGYGRLLSEML